MGPAKREGGPSVRDKVGSGKYHGESALALRHGVATGHRNQWKEEELNCRGGPGDAREIMSSTLRGGDQGELPWRMCDFRRARG